MHVLQYFPFHYPTISTNHQLQSCDRLLPLVINGQKPKTPHLRLFFFADLMVAAWLVCNCGPILIMRKLLIHPYARWNTPKAWFMHMKNQPLLMHFMTAIINYLENNNFINVIVTNLYIIWLPCNTNVRIYTPVPLMQTRYVVKLERCWWIEVPVNPITKGHTFI